MKSIDPYKLLRKHVTEALVGAIVFPALVLAGFIIFLFSLAYTHFLGGPYGIAQFLFWALAIVYLTIGYIVSKVYSFGRKKWKNMTSKYKKYRDAEVVE